MNNTSTFIKGNVGNVGNESKVSKGIYGLFFNITNSFKNSGTALHRTVVVLEDVHY